MDLNHIVLPAWMVADLYPSSLIDNDDSPATFQLSFGVIEKKPETRNDPGAATRDGWNWLGDNRKNILIIVHYPGMSHLPEGELKFLTAVLSACKLYLEDVAIVNLNDHPDAGYQELLAHFKSKIVLLFGTEPAAFGLPMNFPHFQLQPFSNCTFLFTPALKELEEDKVLKSKLWVCLRRLFGL